MAETDRRAKDKIIAEFEMMKAVELTARDLYARIAADPDVQPKKVKDAFSSLAKDEQQHADLVEEIVNIVRNAL
jgi:rubrerythrin